MGLLSKLREKLSNPGTFEVIVNDHRKKFQPDSRSWLFAEFDAWFDDKEELLEDGSKKISKKSSKSVFWLQAGAGMGKTVFASELVHRFREQRPQSLLGVVFFNFKEVSTQGPAILLKSIVYQIAQSYPSILNELLKLLEERDETTVEGIFDRILVKSLKLIASQQPTTQKQHLIIFDALDECGLEGSHARRDLMQLFQRKFLRLPGVKLFVTGRPEKDIEDTLNAFSHKIEDGDPRHLEDLKQYIHFSVNDVFNSLMATKAEEGAATSISIQQAADLIFLKSEGRFIYTALVMDQLSFFFEEEQSEFSFSDFKMNLDNLPQGIDGFYRQTFDKLIGFLGNFAKDFLLLIVGTREAIAETSVKDLLNIRDANFSMLKNSTAAFFPLVNVDGIMTFVPYHKSIIDWLMGEQSRSYLGDEESHVFIASKLLKKVKMTWKEKIIDAKDYLIDDAEELHQLKINMMLMERKTDDPSLLYVVRHLTHHLNNSELGLVTYFLMTNLT